MKNHDFQELVDRNLSGLVWDERMRRSEHSALDEEERPVKKISRAFILAAAILCLAVTALAAGLVFSPKVDADKLADEALLETYGITPEMLTFFNRSSSQEDGAFVVRYDGANAFSYVLGSYTVTVKGGRASAAWSWDGTDVSDNFEGDAWGAKQLAEMCTANRLGSGLHQYANRAKAVAAHNNVITPDSGAFDEAEFVALMEKEAREAEEAKAAAKLSVEEMEAIARQAVAVRYSLGEEAAEYLGNEEENGYYRLFGDGELPCYEFFFTLGYEEDGWQGAGRGVYHVTINAENGTVEDIAYDSDLGGEG